jgi:eukaryotic-like serine/threonine-protein kinase
MIMWRELQPDDPGRIGPYRLHGVVGSGGMGRVFLGVSADGRMVAVKVIRADLATDPEFRARFRREVTVARKVSSRFTVPLIDADVDGPVPWLATGYVPGPSLADAVTEHGPLPARSVLELATGLAAGLSAIHAAGVVHRDLKPSNVLLAQDGPRVIDFGISVAAETSPLTRTGLLIGSPGYMSPEQVEGREVSSASDIFSLGAVLAFAATGEAPFGNGSAPTLAYRAVYREVNLDRVPADVRPLIRRCLAKDPGQRPTARDLDFGAAAAVPATLPEAVTRTFAEFPDHQVPSRTVTSARLSPASAPAAGDAGRHRSRRQRRQQRRLARPLTVASLVVGLLAASAAGGLALAASAHQMPGTHSGQAVSGRVTSPATSAPAAAASSTARAASAAPSMSASATAPAAAGTTPAATPSAVMSPTASPSGTPAASSSPAPSASPSGSGSPAPAGSPTPTPAAS